MNDLTRTQLDCEKSLDELSDYLSRDRTPYDESIETCPECLNALEALERLGPLSRDLIAEDAAALPPLSDSWIGRIMTNIHREMRSGRSVPISHSDPHVTVTVTEGAIRALIRAAGDAVTGILVGRCELLGDLDTVDAPITVRVTASIAWGESVPGLADEVRVQVYRALAQHTQIRVVSVDVAIEDVHIAERGDAPSNEGERP
ncbi:Asp23/Gls24 family envelope stress response protein [Streptomyces sp. ISL-90]|nr:Asp23/Gls24 family envelope stress response protein [Streptomyces sp. ISL-90]